MSEPNNSDRAAWAESAVNTFGTETYCGRTFTATVIDQPNEGDDAYTMCQDLISDILHLAVLHGWDASEIVRKAVANFDDELSETAERESGE